jgi:hypothetical protein
MKKRAVTCLILLTLAACSSPLPAATGTPLPPVATDTSIPTFSPTSGTEVIATSTVATLPIPPTSTKTSAPAAATSTPLPPVTGIYNPYAVILVGIGDVLNIRSGAGVGNALVGALQPTAVGVNRIGPASSAGGDRWVEIQNPAGGTGWVNANFLSEHVASSTFCSDSRVPDLLNSLKTALLNSNGDLLSSLVSPVHGLDLRLWRYGTVANYSPEEAAWVFESEYVVSWGPAPGSGEETRGTFSNQPLPKLQEVFGANYALHCNNTLDLATFSLEPWPSEYANLNFYTVYKPGTDQYGGLDWRAWIAGVEYVQGKPTLFALIHFQWEP